MKKQIIKKLNQQSGESLAETLVALLIAALALVMLASMISSTTRIVTRSRTTMNSYYSKNNKVAEQREPEGAANITLAPDGGTGASKDYSVSVYPNNILGNTPVVSYRISATPPDGGENTSGGN